jgi:hypothetical protein
LATARRKAENELAFEFIYASGLKHAREHYDKSAQFILRSPGGFQELGVRVKDFARLFLAESLGFSILLLGHELLLAAIEAQD